MKIELSGSILNWVIFYYIFTIIGKKYLMVEWLSWLPYKSGFIYSNILETSKNGPNTPPSLKLLKQRVHELVGGQQGAPQTTLWGAKGLDQERLISFVRKSKDFRVIHMSSKCA